MFDPPQKDGLHLQQLISRRCTAGCHPQATTVILSFIQQASRAAIAPLQSHLPNMESGVFPYGANVR
jgi:hypothetical protein